MWKVPVTQKPDQCLGEWIDREALAEAMIPLIGQLYRNNNVVSSIYGRSLINRSVIAILKAHRFARHRQSDDSELSVHETFPLLKAMSELKLGAASVDLGKLASNSSKAMAALPSSSSVKNWPTWLASRTLRPAKAPTLCCTASVVSAACWRAS
jgi:hypothetical protein